VSAALKFVESVIDSAPFKIFFAVWTGIYLVQVFKGEEGAPAVSEVYWIFLAMAFAVFLV
jgi:hypothetical protein